MVNGQHNGQNGIKGQFQRMSTQFHHWITADGSSGFKAESGRYHLYISWVVLGRIEQQYYGS